MKRQLFILLLIVVTFTTQAQLVPVGIVDAFKKGDAKSLSVYFHTNLEIKLLDQTYVSSKNQATRIIQEFFKEYPPVSFKVDYEGTKKDSKYGLGTLVSKNNSFRVNLYFLEGKEEKIIYFLSIEKSENMYIYSPESLIDLWFKEDIGEGDHTTLSTIPETAVGTAKLLVKEKGILAGEKIAHMIFNKFDMKLEVSTFLEDGAKINVGDIILTVKGKVWSILQSERLVLNVMQRMSGIATETARYVKELEGTGTRVLDTRKTTPGFRYMEKEAVRIGGGVNHRIGLYDMILIKDNHIDFAGGITKAIDGTVKYLAKHRLNLKIEVEVRSMEDIEEVLTSGKADRLMLDNFTVQETMEAVKLIAGRLETESSGGIVFNTLRAYAECGVDYISVGALTHQIKSLDLSLKAEF